MLHVHHRHRLLAALLALAAGGAGVACDPTPAYPQPAQPLVGRVVFERELTMDTTPVDIRTLQATLHVDVGTVPVGTKILVRIVDGIVKDLTGGTAADVWSFDGQPAAVQLLTDAPTFARPIRLTVSNFTGRSDIPDVLHADEGAAAWTRIGPATTPPPPSLSVFTASLTEPHLWTMAVPPLSQAGAPRGLYHLDWLTCDGNTVAATPVETLEIDRSRYAWTRGAAGDLCATVERGAISLDVGHAWATFAPDDGGTYGFELQIEASNAFFLKGVEPRPRDCPANATTALTFVRPIVDAGEAGAPPEASDGGCASDAGGSGDAQGG